MKSQTRHKQPWCHADFWILLCASLFLLVFACTEAQNLLLDGGIRHSAVYRAVLLLLICALFYCGTYLYAERMGNKQSLCRLMLFFFLLYLYLLVNLTLLDRSLGRGTHTANVTSRQKRSYYLERFVNFIPFQSIWEVYIQGFLHGYVNSYYMLLNLLGNLSALTPFAFFLPYFFKTQRKWYVFLPTMLVTVSLIEALQFLFMVGSCDVDDLILNVGGAFLMFLLLRVPIMQKLTEKLTGIE